MKFLAALFGALLLTVAMAVATLAFGLRTKSPPVLRAVRAMNRACVNPRQTDAGSPGAYASLIGHTGRTTGTAYQTPVQAVPTADGFAIALPYGSQSDWLRNVLASGSATIAHEGRTHRVTDPTVVPMETAAIYFSPRDQRAHRLFGTDECLIVRTAPPDEQVHEPTGETADPLPA
jgi:deazaflavin-dependent oxidoreductase (nitroreductase family)